MSRLSRAVARLVLCVSAQLMRFHCRIPQHSISSVVPIWVCRLRRVDVVFAGRCCACCAVRWLCSAREQTAFAAAFMKVIGATRALLRVLLELQIGVLGNLQHSSPRGSSLKLRFLARELSKLVWHACFRRDRGNLKLGQNPGESHAVCHNLHALLPYAVSLLTNTCRGSHLISRLQCKRIASHRFARSP